MAVVRSEHEGVVVRSTVRDRNAHSRQAEQVNIAQKGPARAQSNTCRKDLVTSRHCNPQDFIFVNQPVPAPSTFFSTGASKPRETGPDTHVMRELEPTVHHMPFQSFRFFLANYALDREMGSNCRIGRRMVLWISYIMGRSPLSPESNNSTDHLYSYHDQTDHCPEIPCFAKEACPVST